MFIRLINGLTAAFLAIMSILVFGNVVLRYAFNSGITWSEEMARFLFIWLILIGAISTLKDNQHLGVDMLVKRLSKTGKKDRLHCEQRNHLVHLMDRFLWKLGHDDVEYG